MRNITLSADEKVIQAARERARRERTTINEQFRRWLEDYASAGRRERAERAMATIRALEEHVDTGGRKFTREEMNER